MTIDGYKQIPGLPVGYLVNMSGEIISTRRGVIQKLKCSVNGFGYRTFSCYQDNKSKSIFVHKCVAKVYCNNPENKPIVNHKDGDKLNNHYLNLEWVTKSEDVRHCIYVLNRPVIWTNEEKKKPIIVYKNHKKIKFNSITEASVKLNISRSAISNCLTKRSQTAGGMKWAYQ